METTTLNAGKYVLVPCTYVPGFVSKFNVSILGDKTVVSASVAEGPTTALKGSWTGGTSGGSFQNSTWRSNPQYLLLIGEPGSITITLSQDRISPLPLIGVAVIRPPAGTCSGDSSPFRLNVYADAAFYAHRIHGRQGHDTRGERCRANNEVFRYYRMCVSSVFSHLSFVAPFLLT